MGVVEILYIILPIFAGIFATAGYALPAFNPPELKKAKLSFVVVGLLLAGMVVMWGVTTNVPSSAIRMIFVGLFAAIIAVGTVESVRWVVGKEMQLSRVESDSLQTNKSAFVNININDFDQIIWGSLTLSLAFVNRTDEEIVVRSISVGQTFRSLTPYNGSPDFRSDCQDVAFLLNPRMMPLGQTVSVSNAFSAKRFALQRIQVNDSASATDRFVMPPKKITNVEMTFKLDPYQAPYNIMNYCLAISHVDPSGKNVTAVSNALSISKMRIQNKEVGTGYSGPPPPLSLAPQISDGVSYVPF